MPSQKVLSVTIVVIALVASIMLAFGRDNTTTIVNRANNLVAGGDISIPENPDWQNELGNLETGFSAPQEQQSSSTPNTLTDAVSVSLMSNYLALKQSGQLNGTSAQNLINQVTGLANQGGGLSVAEPKLTIIADNGNQTITSYGESLGRILKTDRPTVNRNEMDIIKEVINSRNSQKMAELGPIIATYKKIASDLTAMPVPKTFVKAHTDMVKGAQGMTLGLEQISKIFEDPIKGIAALQLYENSAVMFMKATKATGNFIIQSGITYKQGSGGYYLIYGL